MNPNKSVDCSPPIPFSYDYSALGWRRRLSEPPVGYREMNLDRLTNSDAYLAIFAPPSVASRTRPEAIVAARRHNRSPTRPTAGGEELSLETGLLVEGAAAAQVARLVKVYCAWPVRREISCLDMRVSSFSVASPRELVSCPLSITS